MKICTIDKFCTGQKFINAKNGESYFECKRDSGCINQLLLPNTEPIPFQQAFNRVVKELKENGKLYYKYESKISMAFFNAYLNHGLNNFPHLPVIAHVAAKNFLDSLIKKGREE